MGMLTMFFVAPPAELPLRKWSDGVPAAFPSLECNFVDEWKVAMLDNILTGRNPAEALRALTNQCVYIHDESGISVLQLGADLVKALATQTVAAAQEPAKKWLTTAPWGGFG